MLFHILLLFCVLAHANQKAGGSGVPATIYLAMQTSPATAVTTTAASTAATSSTPTTVNSVAMSTTETTTPVSRPKVVVQQVASADSAAAQVGCYL
jgi:hypothetical protein